MASHEPRTIEVDYKGEPVTSGIKVHNNAEYAVKAAVGGVIAWHLAPFLFGAWAFVIFLIAIPCLAPGVIPFAMYNNHVASATAGHVGLVLLIIGLFPWLYFSWKFTRWSVGGFMRHTKFQCVGPYEGPGQATINSLKRAQYPGYDEEEDVKDWLSWNNFDSAADAVIAWNRHRWHRDTMKTTAKLTAQSPMWQRAWYQYHRSMPNPVIPSAPPAPRRFDAAQWDEMRRRAYPDR